MKKKLIIAAIVIVIALVSCFLIYDAQIPDLKVEYKNTQIEVIKCPLGWYTLFRGTRWEYPAPPEIAKSISAVTVEPNAVLELSFSKKPKSYNVSSWNESREDYPNEENSIKVPAEKGTYIFDVIGHWDNGEVMYVFKINVG